MIPCKISLDLIPKASSNDKDTQAYLYTQQPENLNDVGLQTTSIDATVKLLLCSSSENNTK